MKLEDLQNTEVLVRPLANKKFTSEGSHEGVITLVELVERKSRFDADGKRVMLNFHIEVEDETGELIELYSAVNYTWSAKGQMIKTLEKLGFLPSPGQAIDLKKMINTPVLVVTENVVKDGVTYSNIVSIKRRHTSQQPVNASVESVQELLQNQYSTTSIDEILDIN